MKTNENQENTSGLASSILLSAPDEMPKYVSVIYEPCKDITTYELATLVPLLSNKLPITEGTLAELGSAARHLKRHA